MKSIFGSVVIALLLSLLWGCKESDEVFVESGLEYFPIANGLYSIYAVDSILIQADLATFDTSSFFIKEVQDSVYIDSEGNTVITLLRYKRTTESEPWELIDAWKTYRNSSRAHRVEENEDLLVLSLPASLTSEWNLNAYNTRDAWLASYSEIHHAYDEGEMLFDSVLTVQQEPEVNVISRRFEERKYAKHVGLIERDAQILEFNTVVPETVDPLASEIEYGVTLHYKIIEYGQE